MVYIIRGFPGDGKTSFAKKCFGKFLLIEADQMFVQADHTYVHDSHRDRNGYVYDMLKTALRYRVNCVITTCVPKLKNLQILLDLIERYNSNVTIYEMVKQHSGSSSHPIEPERIEQMHDQFEPHPDAVKVYAWHDMFAPNQLYKKDELFKEDC